MIRNLSRLQKVRMEYKPPLPAILKKIGSIRFHKGAPTHALSDREEIKKLFPHTYGRPIMEGREEIHEERHGALTVGVVFSGGQAAGGHNVISGLYDAMHQLNKESRLIGFLGGPSGIIENKTIKLTQEQIAPYRNQGGFDLIGSGRTKIDTSEQLEASLKTVQELDLDGLVVIGGDDSNTNAAILAEYFLNKGCKTVVVGVPKTIDGDLKNEFVASSFGFDTAAKIYSEMIGNIARDALSAKKYYHFIKLMGRSASHITLECGLSTHPNITLIGEEVAQKKMTLSQVTKMIADVVVQRAEMGKNYGIVLIPEGLIEFIPEIRILIQELNIESDKEKLTPESRHCFEILPDEIQEQLLMDRDPHGNVQVSLIETEKLLIHTVQEELKSRSFKGKFAALSHFFGYEGRSGFPSNFDTHYCYSLGHVAALLVQHGLTGYMTCVGNLKNEVENWTISGLPLTMLMNIEMRKGKKKPVIQKALVDLKGKPFAFFAQHRGDWAIEDQYRFTGPIQFFGEWDIANAISLTLQLE